MKGIKHSLLAVALAAALGTGVAQAQISDNVIKIGVLSDSALKASLAKAHEMEERTLIDLALGHGS